jgi:hypothetical protein
MLVGMSKAELAPAVVAAPLYEPQNTTDRLPWMRTASVVFGLVLVVAAVYVRRYR